MRALKLLHLALVSGLVATSAALYAQDEKPQDDKPRQEEPKRQDEARPSKQDKNDQKQEEKQSRDETKTGRQAPQEHARPAGKTGHIPDEKFHAQFGRGHNFHPPHPQVVNGQTQFVYGGFNFVIVDAWPGDWAYTDDCYIDYVDGEYFLFDLRHPGVRISLFVVL